MVATTLPGVATVLTSIVVGADGHETTLLRTTTLPGQVSFYATAVTMHVTERAHWHPARLVTKTDVFGRPTATVEVLDGGGRPDADHHDAQGCAWRSYCYGNDPGSGDFQDGDAVRVSSWRSAHADCHGCGIPNVSRVGDRLGSPLAQRRLQRRRVFRRLLRSRAARLAALSMGSSRQHSHQQGLPFAAMARRGGAAACGSLNLNPSGLSGKLHGFRLLWRFGDPLSLLADLLVLLSAVTTVLSSSAVGLKLIGSCEVDDATGCRITLGVYMDSTRQVEALLAMTTALIAVCLFLKLSAVASPPWTIAAMAALLASSRTLQDMLKALRSIPTPRDTRTNAEQLLTSGLHEKRFSLNEGEIRVSGSEVENLDKAPGQHAITTEKASRLIEWWERLTRNLGRDRAVQGAFLILLCGIFSLVLYYELTETDTPFGRFMDNQGYGVRTLFMTFGVVVFWDYHCSRACQPRIRQVPVGYP